MSILDLIFPKKCVNCGKYGDLLCANCFSKIKYIENTEFPKNYLDGCVCVVAYNGVVKKLVRQFKYKPYVQKLGQIIADIMNESLIQNEILYAFILKNKPVVIPIPLSSNRKRVRGYNHAEIIGSYVAKYLGLRLVSDLLTRVKDTKPQYNLNRKERINNLIGAFELAKNQKIPKSVILIDDVATTLATLNESAKVLKKAGVKNLFGVTFAREL